jgi:glycerophosphoryl diester phosphodiesterase
MKINPYFLLFFFFFLFSHCTKDQAITPPITNVTTRFIGHKAGGKGMYLENTLEAAELCFTKMDGIEIDLQLSRSGTIWLFHDEYFDSCDINKLGRIPAYTDQELSEHMACIGLDYHLSKLEDIFVYHRANNLDKKISLDVKSWLPTKYSDAPSYLYRLAAEVIRLTKKYNMGEYLFVECEAAFFLDQLNQSNLGFSCFLVSFGDFYKAIAKANKANYAGLSFKYSPDKPLTEKDVSTLHKQGLKIQYWTLNEVEEMNWAVGLGVDYIQTDNIDRH